MFCLLFNEPYIYITTQKSHYNYKAKNNCPVRLYEGLRVNKSQVCRVSVEWSPCADRQRFSISVITVKMFDPREPRFLYTKLAVRPSFIKFLLSSLSQTNINVIFRYWEWRSMTNIVTIK